MTFRGYMLRIYGCHKVIKHHVGDDRDVTMMVMMMMMMTPTTMSYTVR